MKAAKRAGRRSRQSFGSPDKQSKKGPGALGKEGGRKERDEGGSHLCTRITEKGPGVLRSRSRGNGRG